MNLQVPLQKAPFVSGLLNLPVTMRGLVLEIPAKTHSVFLNSTKKWFRPAKNLEAEYHATTDKDIVLVIFSGVGIQRRNSREKVSNFPAHLDSGENSYVKSESHLKDPGSGSLFARIRSAKFEF